MVLAKRVLRPLLVSPVRRLRSQSMLAVSQRSLAFAVPNQRRRRLTDDFPVIENTIEQIMQEHDHPGELAQALAMYIIDKIKKNPNVRVRDPAALQAKLQQIIRDGYDKLLVISDFDFTLSRYKDNTGQRCLTTHGVFDDCTKELYPKLAEELGILVKKYIPIEFCPNMSVEEKTPHMEDWWRTSHQKIVENKFTYEQIEEFVSRARLYLRDAAVEFIRSVEAHNVPLVLFSAGIGNIIEIILKKALGHVPHTLHVISNLMEFDDNNVCVNFTEPLIHTFCKNSSVITGERPFFHHVRNRTNVILLGDSLGDINMDVGIENEGTSLKIGFLNFDFDNLLPRYTEVYDIVIIDSQTMELPLEIFRFCGLTHPQSVTNLQDLCHATVASEKPKTEDDMAVPNVSA
uniref:5'-nucleotidase n=1 Tax=Panagrellus redivivus TaxID=6233 RepID=A0A7E4UMG3_PANRE